VEVIENKILALGPVPQFPCREERESRRRTCGADGSVDGEDPSRARPAEVMSTRVMSARRAEDVVLTRDRRAEDLELIDTGVQVGFVREDVLLGR